MESLTLVVMAAGLGSRYSGLKQIDGIGPAGETLIHYAVYDALRAGFSRVVFVIRRDIEEPFKAAVGRYLQGVVEVEYAFQELDAVADATAMLSRKKPWGTAHAILVAARAVKGPFAVINGDDFYGQSSFRSLAEHLQSDPQIDDFMVGFVLRNTLSDFGGVKRGICKVDPDGFLISVEEYEDIRKDGSQVTGRDASGIVHSLSGDELVSMNMWGFRPTLFPYLQKQWTKFVADHIQNESDEFFIPDVVSELIEHQHMRCRVIRSGETWFGMTYPGDRLPTIERVRNLIAQGEYPEQLWSLS